MRKDVLENRTGNYRVIMPVLLAALFSAIGFLFISIDELSLAKICVLCFGVIILAIGIAIFVVKNEKYLKELEKL